jgi:hypothetical protein
MIYSERTTAVLRTASEPGEKVREGFTRRIIRTGSLMTVVLVLKAVHGPSLTRSMRIRMNRPATSRREKCCSWQRVQSRNG